MDPHYEQPILKQGLGMSTMLWANNLRINKIIPNLQAQAGHITAQFRITQSKFEEMESKISSLLADQMAVFKEEFGQMLTAQTQLQQRDADAKIRRAEDGHIKVMENLQRRLEIEQKLRMDLQNSVTAHMASNNQRYSAIRSQLEPMAVRADRCQELHVENSRPIQKEIEKLFRDHGELRSQVEKLDRASNEIKKHDMQRFDQFGERLDSLNHNINHFCSRKTQNATKTPPRKEASISTDSEVSSPFIADHAMKDRCAEQPSEMPRHLPKGRPLSHGGARSVRHIQPLESPSGSQIDDTGENKSPPRTPPSDSHPTAASESVAPAAQIRESGPGYQDGLQTTNNSSRHHSSVRRPAKVDAEELTLLSSTENLTMRPSRPPHSGAHSVAIKLHTHPKGFLAESVSSSTKELDKPTNVAADRSAKSPESYEQSCMDDSTLSSPRNVELPRSTTGAERDETHMAAHTLRDSVNASSESINPSLSHSTPKGDILQDREISIEGGTHSRVRTTAEEAPRQPHAAIEDKTPETHRKTNVIGSAKQGVTSSSYYECPAGPRRSKRILDKTVITPSQSKAAPRSVRKTTGPKKSRNASNAASKPTDGQIDGVDRTSINAVVGERNNAGRLARSTTQSLPGDDKRNQNEVSHDVTSLTSVRKRSRIAADLEAITENGRKNATKRRRLIVVLPMKFSVSMPP